MRILDQNGISDIPYEHAVIMIEEGAIIAYMPAAAGNNLRVFLAAYSSFDIAKKALKKLHIAYQRANENNSISCMVNAPSLYFIFPQEEDLI